MKQVKLTIGDKTYEKTNPTIKDWFDQQDLLLTTEGKNIVTNREGADSVISFVAQFLDINKESIIEANLPLKEVLEAYKTIQANILSCFLVPTPSKDKPNELEAD